MYNTHDTVWFRATMSMAALVVFCTSSQPSWAQANLENPQAGSFHSGLGIVSGWVCNASRVDLVFDGATTVQAAYGTARADTVSACGDANNGFGLLVNWNLLGEGTHMVQVLADGVQVGSAAFTVSTMSGAEFLSGVEGSFRLPGFPDALTEVIIRWDEHLQNFVIVRVEVNLSGFNPVAP